MIDIEQQITRSEIVELFAEFYKALEGIKQFWLAEQRAIVESTLGYEVDLKVGDVGWSPALEYTLLLRKKFNEFSTEENKFRGTFTSSNKNETNCEAK